MNMGVDTHLYINAKWEVEDVKTVLEKHLLVENLKVIDCHKTACDMFMLTFKYNNEDRNMYVHGKSKTPLGTTTLLSLGCWGSSKTIMGKIASVMGGYFVPEDTTDTGEMINGLLFEDDGLQWYLIQAALENRIEHNRDIEGLKKTIEYYREKFKKQSNQF